MWWAWLALIFGAIGIYYGCSRGFKARQWEHRYNEQAKQNKHLLNINADWAMCYQSWTDNFSRMNRELSLLRAGELADKARIQELERMLRRDFSNEKKAHDHEPLPG